jgi:hypothetical protein
LRDALRKFIEKDIDHFSTEIGFAMIKNVLKNETLHLKDNINIKSSMNESDREETFASIPWYVNNGDMRTLRTSSECSLINLLNVAVKNIMRRNEVLQHAESHIILIAPGWHKCTQDEQVSEIIKLCKDNMIKITTLNYPQIVSPRVPLDILSIKTGGQMFTIFEQKQNEENRYL